MIQFGTTLKAAREAKGLTIAQIAETTRMMSSMVQDLENENFTKIAAPIYGRGFVKLYCEAVGLDPKPLVAEFMDIYNGNRELTIRERPVEQSPVTPPEPPAPPSPAADTRDVPPEPAPSQPAPSQPGLFDPPVPPAPAPSPAPEPRIEPAPSPAPSPAPKPRIEPAPSPAPVPEARPHTVKYTPVNPGRDFESNASGISPSLWRWAVIAVAAGLLIWVIGLGIRALYHATAPEAASPEATAAAEILQPTKPPAAKAPTQQPAATPDVPRTPQEIPQLYIN